MTWKFDQGPLTLTTPGGQHLYDRAKALEEAIDKSQTRIVGTQDDERFADAQEARRSLLEGKEPQGDGAPPPTSEDDYGGSQGRKETIEEKAKRAPF
jgi:hypothetical protein